MKNDKRMKFVYYNHLKEENVCSVFRHFETESKVDKKNAKRMTFVY